MRWVTGWHRKPFGGPSEGRRLQPPLVPITRLVLALLDPDELSQHLLDVLKRSSHYKGMALILCGPEDEAFRVRAWSGYGGVDFSRVQFARESPLIRHFGAHPVPTEYGQLERTPWLKVLSRGEREALAVLGDALFVPLSDEGSLEALLVLRQAGSTLRHRRAGPPSAAERRQVARVIAEARLHQLLKLAEGSVSALRRPQEIDQPQPFEQAARGIAHDLNNILATILSHAELLEGEFTEVRYKAEVQEAPGVDMAQVGSDRERIKRYAAVIRQAVRDGADSVRRMHGLGEELALPQDTPVEVNGIIRSALHMIEPRWRLGRISPSSAAGGRMARGRASGLEVAGAGPDWGLAGLSVSLGPAGYVSGNPAELRRVLTNLMSNAVDALHPYGGHIEISSGKGGGWAFIRVRDNGTGVSPEILGRIYEFGFTTKGHRGSGLGLSVSQGIAARHGGRIEVESEEGVGSVFSLVLPLAGDDNPGDIPGAQAH